MTNRRAFIKAGGILAASVLVPSFIACSDSSKKQNLSKMDGENSSKINGENLNQNLSTNSSQTSGGSLSETETNSENSSEILKQFYTLNNGVKIPKLGLGLWRIPNDKVAAAVGAALELGYKHFDTAQAYANEQGVGVAINKALNSGKFSREELFITSKIRAEFKSYEEALKSIDESLENLNLSYIDLMLIHSPQPWSDFRGGDYFEENLAVFKALEVAQKAGKVRSIGVSNFLQKDIENILKNCELKPAVNQILLHIGRTDFALLDYCKEQGILVEAYSPIAHGTLLKDERLVKMAKKYSVSVPQLCVKYALELGALPLPKSANPAHIKENARLNFTLLSADLEELKMMKFNDYGEHSHFPVFSGK